MAEHKIERRVNMMVDRFQMRLRQLIDYATMPDGRIIFNEKLEPEEQQLEFVNPVTRGQIEDILWGMGGPDAVFNYRKAMTDKMRKQYGKVKR